MGAEVKRRLSSNLAAAAGVLALIGAVGAAAGAQPGAVENRPGATRQQFEQWMTELSNWGRWGADDTLGTANLITPAKRLEALALPETGASVSLAHDLTDAAGGPAFGAPFALDMVINRDPPQVRDRLNLDYHGVFFTHLDAICHMVHDGRIYNGHDFVETVTEGGCSRYGIEGLRDGIVTRAVLIDMPRLKGVPYLQPGTRIYPADIEAWEKMAGVRVGAGDALLVRTGRWARRAELGNDLGWAGMDASFLPLLKERDVALFGSDTAHEVGLDNIPGLRIAVIHKFAIVALGMNLLDNLDLEAAAETAARLGRWEFLLMASPVRVPRGTGSPINPIAVF